MLSKRAVIALVVVSATSTSGWWLGEQRRTSNPQVRVLEVIDGDTVVVAFADGSTDTIRILGVDTPEVAKHHLPPKSVGTCRNLALRRGRSRWGVAGCPSTTWAVWPSGQGWGDWGVRSTDPTCGARLCSGFYASLEHQLRGSGGLSDRTRPS